MVREVAASAKSKIGLDSALCMLPTESTAASDARHRHPLARSRSPLAHLGAGGDFSAGGSSRNM